MADARITIEGAIASDPRFNTTQGGAVANLRVLAGRSRKDDQGNWETLSTTAYDVAFWNAHHNLAADQQPEKGSKVIVTGTVTGVESYDGKNGPSLSVKVTGDGLRVFPKRDQQGNPQQGQAQGNWGPQQGQQAQQGGPSYSQAQQQAGWGQSPNQQQGDPWASSAPQQDGPPF